MIVTMEATLLVLAGGSSRRMGRAKAWLEVGDTILLRWVVDRLAPAFAEVMTKVLVMLCGAHNPAKNPPGAAVRAIRSSS